MFYDLHIQADAEKAAHMARRLGLNGIGLTVQSGNIANPQEARAKGLPIDVAVGMEIKARESQISNLAKGLRRRYELILVRGGTEEINRAALETPEVDVLFHTNLENGQCGINHILARLGAKNNVAICFDLLDILQSYKKTRSQLLTSMMETARFVKKYKCPFVISSGALNEWDMRAPSELMAFGKFLGFDERQCKKALDGGILRENRKRLGGKWVMPGVEVE
jgi:ribonuclease P/MRP protein subunit RPP1